MLYAIKRTDGGVTILRIIDPETDVGGEVAKWRGAHINEYVSHHAVEEEHVPTDRTFRNAWTFDARRGFLVDMPKARNVRRDQMRIARKPLLEALDAVYMRAMERGDSELQKEIDAHKQALRDVTDDPAIEIAATPEALKLVWPSVLGPHPFR